ncbi:MAG: hypothetical protein Q6373_024395 [Candidatus Sigynarchaeota archaeon]
MKDKKKEPTTDDGDSEDLGGMLGQFKENITISRDDEGIILKFKALAPGMTLESLKSMMEGMMGAGGKDMLKQFQDMMSAGEDDDLEDAGSPDDEDDGDDEENGPGFRVEILADGTGLKLIPDDPEQIDEFLESIKAIFDPEMFQKMMRAVFQLFGMQGPGAPGSLEGGSPPKKGDKKKGTDTNMTWDYFYT